VLHQFLIGSRKISLAWIDATLALVNTKPALLDTDPLLVDAILTIVNLMLSIVDAILFQAPDAIPFPAITMVSTLFLIHDKLGTHKKSC
jgi:hypothetical protein